MEPERTKACRQASTDRDPLFRFHRWLANLRVLEIAEIKSVPYPPVSHPFVERLIGNIRREYLDHVFFRNAVDLALKLGDFRDHYNVHRAHRSLDGATPAHGLAQPRPLPPRSIVTLGAVCCGGMDVTGDAITGGGGRQSGYTGLLVVVRGARG